MVMLGDDVARLEQSAIDEGSMFEMGYFSALWDVMEQLQIWEDMSNTTSLRYWHQLHQGQFAGSGGYLHY